MVHLQSLESNVNSINLLTAELAKEVHDNFYGQAFKCICAVFDGLHSIVAITDDKCNLIYLNKAAIDYVHDLLKINIKVGDHCLALLANNYHMCETCLSKKAMVDKRVMNEIFISPNTGIKYWRTAIPLVYDGVSGAITILERYND